MTQQKSGGIPVSNVTPERKLKVKCKNKKKKKEERWGSEPSTEERFERIKVKLLHVPKVTYGLQHGIDIDAFTKQLDPLKQWKLMKELGQTGVFVSKTLRRQCRASQRSALIAAAKLSTTFPRNYDPMLSISTATISDIEMILPEFFDVTVELWHEARDALGAFWFWRSFHIVPTARYLASKDITKEPMRPESLSILHGF